MNDGSVDEAEGPLNRRLVLAFGLSLLVLGLFIVLVGWEAVLTAVADAHLGYYSFAFAGCVWCLFARSLVWNRLLGLIDKRRPYWLVGSIFLTAMFTKYVTPYGQVTSGIGIAALVSRYYESAYEESLAAILSADFINYIPYYTFGGIGLGYLLLIDSPPFSILPYLVIALTILGGIILVALFLYLGRDAMMRVLTAVGTRVRERIARLSDRWGNRLRAENLRTRFSGFRTTLEHVSHDRRTLIVVVLYAHAGWLGFAMALYASAYSIGQPLSIPIVLLAVALSKVGFLVPTPGGVGGVEIALASVLFVISPLGGTAATAVAILYRFATYWWTVLLGGLSSIALTLADPTPS